MKKVTDEEFERISNLRETLLQIITVVGELSISKMILDKQKAELEGQIEEHKQKFFQFQESERVLFEQLREKYGTGNINMETGEITEETTE